MEALSIVTADESVMVGALNRIESMTEFTVVVPVSVIVGGVTVNVV